MLPRAAFAVWISFALWGTASAQNDTSDAPKTVMSGNFDGTPEPGNGKSVAGNWDMGGATTRGPIESLLERAKPDVYADFATVFGVTSAESLLLDGFRPWAWPMQSTAPSHAIVLHSPR